MEFFSIYSLGSSSSSQDAEQNEKIAHLAKVVELLCEKLGQEVVIKTIKEGGWFTDPEVKITLKDKSN